MAFDEATQGLLQQLATADRPPMHETDPGTARATIGALAAFAPPGPDMDRKVETDAVSGVDSIVLRPQHPRGVLVWWHGGGWVTGAPGEHEQLGRVLADRTGLTVVLAGYRLAPEHRYPAAVDDAWRTLQWAHHADLAPAGSPLLVGGDSAGANLATVVSARARGERGLTIAGQVLIYPITDHDFTTESYRTPENQYGLSADTMKWFWDFYADASDRNHPDASPLRSPDLSNMPPAVVVTAEHDVLRDEGEAYAHALEAAGNTVKHRRFDGQIHGFFTLYGILPAGAQAIDFVVEEINGTLGDSHG